MARDFTILNRIYSVVEKAIIITLLVTLMVVVLWASGAYAFELFRILAVRLFGGQVVSHAEVTSIFERISILHDVFGGFLLILIGVELMKTIAMYLSSHEMHVEVVFTVAIIAIARHAIDLNLAELDALQLIGLGALLLALAVGYYYFRKAASLPLARSTDLRT